LRLNSRAVACWLILHHSAAAYASLTYHSRRHAILSSTAAATAAAAPPAASADTTAQSMMTEVSDGTYSALAYAPRTREVLPPLLVVLHGAGINKLPVWNLADPTGEHAGEMDGFIRQAYSPLAALQLSLPTTLRSSHRTRLAKPAFTTSRVESFYHSSIGRRATLAVSPAAQLSTQRVSSCSDSAMAQPAAWSCSQRAASAAA
jgi:hypothetical protein